MTQHEMLRMREEQHKIKNTISEKDDVIAKTAAQMCVKLLSEKYPNHTFNLKKTLTVPEIREYTKIKIDDEWDDRKIIPDGGIIWMDNKYPILTTEMKHQGTNVERLAEGKKKQSTGNAIERYGKNLIGFHTLYQNDDILPVVAFCHGCDFADDEKTVLMKLYTLNGFNKTNIIYTNPTKQRIKPSSILYKVEIWKIEEMIPIMMKIAESAIDYYSR